MESCNSGSANSHDCIGYSGLHDIEAADDRDERLMTDGDRFGSGTADKVSQIAASSQIRQVGRESGNLEMNPEIRGRTRGLVQMSILARTCSPTAAYTTTLDNGNARWRVSATENQEPIYRLIPKCGYLLSRLRRRCCLSLIVKLFLEHSPRLHERLEEQWMTVPKASS